MQYDVMELIVTAEGLGRVHGDTISILDTPFVDFADLLRQGHALDELACAAAVSTTPLLEAALKTPVGRHGAIWGVGSNYRSEGAHGEPRAGMPTLFLKSTTSVVDPGGAIRLPGDMTTRLDYEGEVAVVVGRPMFDVAESDAWSHVAAITAANDATARDVMALTKNPALAKSFPDIGALGPTLLTLDEIDDIDDISIRSWVNGEERQNSSTRNLIHSVPELLSLLSRFTRLMPGDVVLTGGPTGRGVDSGHFLAPGDVVEIAVANGQVLRNTVESSTTTTSLGEIVKEN
jgi:2-keto-4-pentenoate hydratase/2-oxohepta-3-ene-1,7-dioic acid hydratase in catechol pathway